MEDIISMTPPSLQTLKLSASSPDVSDREFTTWMQAIRAKLESGGTLADYDNLHCIRIMRSSGSGSQLIAHLSVRHTHLQLFQVSLSDRIDLGCKFCP
jgi:hypothetical protein